MYTTPAGVILSSHTTPKPHACSMENHTHQARMCCLTAFRVPTIELILCMDVKVHYHPALFPHLCHTRNCLSAEGEAGYSHSSPLYTDGGRDKY